jgi:RNA polymerase sigma-70 factor, ECF subfamily
MINFYNQTLYICSQLYQLMNLNKDLVKLFKDGDMLAFDTIYKNYCHRLYGFVYKFLKQEEDTEEIIQEVFVKLWESRSKIDVNLSFESYLFTVTYNSTISMLRKRIHETKYIDYVKSLQINYNSDEVFDLIQYDQINDRYLELLEKITPRQKEIFLLSRSEGLSHKEIAQKLDISENTVKNHIVNTLNYFKSNLKRYNHVG